MTFPTEKLLASLFARTAPRVCSVRSRAAPRVCSFRSRARYCYFTGCVSVQYVRILTMVLRSSTHDARERSDVASVPYRYCRVSHPGLPVWPGPPGAPGVPSVRPHDPRPLCSGSMSGRLGGPYGGVAADQQPEADGTGHTRAASYDC